MKRLTIKSISIIILLTLSKASIADITGAGDAAIVTQLVNLVKQGTEQIKSLKETLDVSKKINEFERLKTIKKVSKEGSAMTDLFKETGRFNNEVDGLAKDPFSLDGTQQEIDWVEHKLDKAKNDKNATKAYASILMDLKRLKFLGKAVSESRKKIKNGANTEENQQIAASNSMIMADILLKNEERQKRVDANNTSIILNSLKNPGYSSLKGINQ